jgi:hypothetical protein
MRKIIEKQLEKETIKAKVELNLCNCRASYKADIKTEGWWEKEENNTK